MQAKEHHPLDFVCETGVCIPCLPMHLHHTFPEPNCIGFVPLMLCLNQVMYSASGQDSWGASFCASSRDADG